MAQAQRICVPLPNREREPEVQGNRKDVACEAARGVLFQACRVVLNRYVALTISFGRERARILGMFLTCVPSVIENDYNQ